MAAYVALLRGINVGGRKPVKMDALRSVFQDLGLTSVSTYLQSGNVVFAGTRASPAALAQAIEKRLLRDLDQAIPVLVLPAGRVRGIVAANPFLAEQGLDATKLHVTFPLQAPTPTALGQLDGLLKGPDQARCAEGVVFLHCPQGYGRSKLSNPNLERALAVPATTRNWNTVCALQRLVQEQDDSK